MRYLPGSEVTEALENLIYSKTQQHDYETDLTVGAIFRVIGPGSLDFGGSEYAAAEREPLEPQKPSADDRYGWWDLSPGSYIVRFNETINLAEDQIGFIQPHERLVLAGGHHPAFYFRGSRESLEIVLNTGTGGLRIKENARISKLLILQLE